MTEGHPATISAYLSNAAPTHDVTVAILSADPAKLQVDTPMIVFPLASWRDLQPIHVTALEDADGVDDLAHIELYSPDAVATRFQFDIHDDDVQAIVPSAIEVDVDEGGAATLAVHLAVQPIGSVLVEATTTSPAQNPVDPIFLTFDASTWSMPQTLHITSKRDSNTVSEDTTVELASPETASVDVTIHNHDTGP